MSKFKGETTDLTNEAADLLKKADEGDAEAQYYFGYYLLHDLDHKYRKDLTTEQIDRAFYYYKQSAMTGFMRGAAALEIADAYYSGEIVSQDYKKACMWYNTALLSGNPPAACMLGDYALNGYDCEIDYEKAARYYIKAIPQFIDAVYRLGDMFLNGQFFDRDLEFAKTLYNYVIEEEEKFYGRHGFYSDARKQVLQRLNKLNPNSDINTENMNGEAVFQTGIRAELQDEIIKILNEED